MTDPDSRLARLEARADSHEKRIDGIEKRMDSFSPMFERMAALSEKVASDVADLQSLRVEFATFRSKQEERDEDARQDRQQFNRWLIGLAVVIIAALIGFAGLLLTSPAVHI